MEFDVPDAHEGVVSPDEDSMPSEDEFDQHDMDPVELLTDEVLADDVPLENEEDAYDDGEHEDDEERKDEDDEVTDTPEERHSYNLRANRNRTYENRFDHVMDNAANSKSYDAQLFQIDNKAERRTLREAVQLMQTTGVTEPVQEYVTGFIMTQMTARAGIKKHGQVAVDALFAEFSQLHDLGVFSPEDANLLSPQKKHKALRAINVIKEKRCGRIKGRTVADGSMERGVYNKEDTASPTVSAESLMLSLIIDAKEMRDVATADITGAYLRADMEDYTLLKMEGTSVDIMCDVNDAYKVFVHIEKGKKVLYLRLLKALYGCIKSAMLWYELFASTLQEFGFVLNPYDPCVANKDINGEQCTILWYVDDTKISHVDPQVVSDVIALIETKFDKMVVTRGKVHVFLGMQITLRADRSVEILMKDYLSEAIADFGEPITVSTTTPAKKTLFDVDDSQKELPVPKKEVFHRIVAKLLYVSKRGRPDIQLPIAYLCTRISVSTEHDWWKLRRVLEFLNGTLEDTLILGADDIGTMWTWTDASYAVHENMRSHTGGVISFGRGAAMSKSSKQTINTKSSTEAELVGASDYLSYPIWTANFLNAQGYAMKNNTFYQDNQSTIRFERNGRKSCGPNSRHIDIRYFFIKDRIISSGITVLHCPTEQMLADFFTKPLQGSLFTKFRRVVMGHDHIDSLKHNNACSPTKERVGEDISDKVWNGSRAPSAGTKEGVSTEETFSVNSTMELRGDPVEIHSVNSTKELRGDLETSLKEHGEILRNSTYADAVKKHSVNTVDCRNTSVKVRSDLFSLSKINPIVTTV
jgi:hypothetical protein